MISAEKNVSGLKLNTRKDDIEKKDKERRAVNVIDLSLPVLTTVDLVGISCKSILRQAEVLYLPSLSSYDKLNKHTCIDDAKKYHNK